MEELDAAQIECSANRDIITTNVNWINNTEHFLDIGEEGYEDQQESLNDALVKARQAVIDKPEGCGLRNDGDDDFDCPKCWFESAMLVIVFRGVAQAY